MSQIQSAYAALCNNPVWRQMFEQNPAMQMLIEPVSRIVIDANPPACRFYGYKREEMQSLSLDQIELDESPEDDSPTESTLFIFRHRTRRGEQRDVKINASTYEIDGVSLTHLILVDITKRRRAEAAEQDQRAVTSALANTAAALNSSLNLHDVLDRILEQVQHIIDCDYVNIMLMENDYVTVVRSRGYEKVTDVDEYVSVKLNVNATPTLRWMVENDRMLFIPEISTDSRWSKLHTTEDWLTSYLGVPIRMGNQVIGFLNLDFATRAKFLGYDESALQAFADQAGVAIRNARLFERVRRQALLLEQRVADRTAELDYERRQLRAILDSMTDGVFYSDVDPEGRLQPRYINRAMARLLGVEPAEDLSRLVALLDALNVEDLEGPALQWSIHQALEQQSFASLQGLLNRDDGVGFEATMTTTRVDSSTGELLGAVTVVRDVSQEKALERQRSRFVAQASHELRTPLANMKTRLYLLRRQPDRLESHLPVLEKATGHMWRLVESLLDISRLERHAVQLELSDISVQETVSFVTEEHQPVIEERKQTLRVEMPGEPLRLIADADRVTQVLNNLIANASAYTPEGGSITVHVEGCAAVDSAGNVLPGIRFDVIDTGTGIPEDQREAIFQPFYRIVNNNDGSGLGLSITREIVRLHGGSIRVDAAPGGGSCFTFWLPLKAAAPEADDSGSDTLR
ncbi:MAG: PAS domain S-box protein [Chloroflexi bacterium]|nr:PAS domain S-box protein [Chloroflexota bacterium]